MFVHAASFGGFGRLDMAATEAPGAALLKQLLFIEIRDRSYYSRDTMDGGSYHIIYGVMSGVSVRCRRRKCCRKMDGLTAGGRARLQLPCPRHRSKILYEVESIRIC